MKKKNLDIPQSLKLLVDHGFVEALMDSVLESNDLTIQELSFVWLLKLSSEDCNFIFVPFFKF